MSQPVQLTQFISSRAAEEYPETLEWERYVAYKGTLTLNSSFGEVFTNEPVYILTLNDPGWNVELLGYRLGIGESQPLASDA